MEAVYRTLEEIESMTAVEGGTLWKLRAQAKEERLLFMLGDRTVRHISGLKLTKPGKGIPETRELTDIVTAAKMLRNRTQYQEDWYDAKIHFTTEVRLDGVEKIKLGWNWDGTTVWWTVDGNMHIQAPPAGRTHGSARFSRKSKVNRRRLILWFINSKGSQGATFQEIQRFICELNGYDYDQMSPEPRERRRKTGRKISDCGHPGCTEHQRDEYETWYDGYRLVRTNRGYYCDYLTNILPKYCSQVNKKYFLNAKGIQEMSTATEESPQLPVVNNRQFAEHEEEV